MTIPILLCQLRNKTYNPKPLKIVAAKITYNITRLKATQIAPVEKATNINMPKIMNRKENVNWLESVLPVDDKNLFPTKILIIAATRQ
ncbi:MAG: hypothetical protein DDT31_01604 [Syntrophomonadaceae bacterium]|nr:hypothetical protein [Bacillota bacterium]